MKHFLIILTTFYILINACNDTESNQAPAVVTEAKSDSLKIDERDTLMYRVGANWKPGPHFHQITTPDSTTKIEYTEKNGVPERISAMFYGDSSSTWLTTYHDSAEIKLVRLRQWNLKPQPAVRELFCYLENGAIFYSKERVRYMKEGDPIDAYRDEPFIENVRKPEVLKSEYMPFWEITDAAIKQDIQSRKQ